MKTNIILFVIILLLLLLPYPCSYSSDIEMYNSCDFKYQTAHFVYGLWDNGKVPEKFLNTMNLWEKQGWKIKLWNREMVEKLLEKYPEYNEVVPLFNRKVQLADMARLLILYDEGGHYFDLDCVPNEKHNLYLHLNKYNPSCVFYIETVLKPLHQFLTLFYGIRNYSIEYRVRIANYAFGSHPKHPIIKENLDLLKKRCFEKSDFEGDYDILYKTGPDCTTTSVFESIVTDKEILKGDKWLKHIATGTWRNNKDI